MNDHLTISNARDAVNRSRCQAVTGKRWYVGEHQCTNRASVIKDGIVLCRTHAKLLRVRLVKPTGYSALYSLKESKRVRSVNADLLAALEAIAHCDEVGGVSAGERKGLSRAAAVARAAIAKATGADHD